MAGEHPFRAAKCNKFKELSARLATMQCNNVVKLEYVNAFTCTQHAEEADYLRAMDTQTLKDIFLFSLRLTG